MSDGLTDQRFRPKTGTVTAYSGPPLGALWATERRSYGTLASEMTTLAAFCDLPMESHDAALYVDVHSLTHVGFGCWGIHIKG